MNVEKLTVLKIDATSRTVTVGYWPRRIEDEQDVPFRSDHVAAHAHGCPCELMSGYRLGQGVDVVTP